MNEWILQTHERYENNKLAGLGKILIGFFLPTAWVTTSCRVFKRNEIKNYSTCMCAASTLRVNLFHYFRCFAKINQTNGANNKTTLLGWKCQQCDDRYELIDIVLTVFLLYFFLSCVNGLNQHSSSIWNRYESLI